MPSPLASQLARFLSLTLAISWNQFSSFHSRSTSVARRRSRGGSINNCAPRSSSSGWPPAASARGFHLGLPDHRWFATDVWRRLLLRSSSFALPDAFGYPPAEGRPLLRAARLARALDDG